MKYFLIAGEASGDLHGANLIKSIKKKDSEADFLFFGGDKMAAQYNGLIRHYKDTAFMGIIDVIKNASKIKKNFDIAKKSIPDFSPDAVILIDYPGFNLKIAEFAKKKGFKVFYFISPKVWAWKEKRIFALKQYVDKIFVIFPFEVEYYKNFGIDAEYYGNPLSDLISEFKLSFDESSFRKQYNLTGQKIIGLLPGSRKQEIQKILPHYKKLAQYFSGYTFVVAGLSSLKDLYKSFKFSENMKILFDKTYEILSISEAAIVTSGTATLETALFGVPQAVTYLPGMILYLAGKLFLNLKYISLVNILLNKKCVEEIIEFNFDKRLKNILNQLLNDSNYKSIILEGYKMLQQQLAGENVTDKIADRILQLV